MPHLVIPSLGEEDGKHPCALSCADCWQSILVGRREVESWDISSASIQTGLVKCQISVINSRCRASQQRHAKHQISSSHWLCSSSVNGASPPFTTSKTKGKELGISCTPSTKPSKYGLSMQITGFSTVFKTSNSFNAKAWDKGPKNVKAFLPTHKTHNTTCICLSSMPAYTLYLHTVLILATFLVTLWQFLNLNPPTHPFFTFLPPKKNVSKTPAVPWPLAPFGAWELPDIASNSEHNARSPTERNRIPGDFSVHFSGMCF